LNYFSNAGEFFFMHANAWLFALFLAAITSLILLFLHHPRIGELFHEHVRDRPKRRLFLAAVGFFLMFAVARLLAYAASRNFGPFHYIYIRGTHVHHLVWGILILLVVGFCFLIEVGTGTKSSSLLASRLMSLLYGVGAALTLDEFSLWLNLEDSAYWTRQGRVSLDAVLLFGAALLIGIWGRGFIKALGGDLVRSRRKKHTSRSSTN
jgi:hypothetical protein